MLAEAVGDFGEFALVGTDGGEVVWLADEIEGAKGFPDLFVAGVHRGDFGAGGYHDAGWDADRVDAAADWRAHIRCPLMAVAE